MTEFSPEKFEDKYANYFPELQTAYRNAFESMSERYDSELIHAIDQQVLNESEPFYESEAQRASEEASGQGPRADGFRIELPENPYERLSGVVVGEEKFEGVLAAYVETLEAELRDVFDLNGESPKV